MSLFSKIMGDPNAKIVKSIQPLIDQINALEADFQKYSEEDLRALTVKFQAECRRLEAESGLDAVDRYLDSILPQAFAAVRESARVILGQRHYDVQLVGGVVLYRGQIAEMKTGEGKTLVATLPLYLQALAGKGVHLVTVNDYLSRVGAGWMAPVYHRLGLTTSVIVHDDAFIYDPEHSDESQYDERLRPFRRIPRQDAYACDITYGTNNEFGFDYLRDNMVSELGQMVQRPFYYSIVDEVDSILIDEARTPLIISGAAEESTDKYLQFAHYAQSLKENEDYNIDEKLRAVSLSAEGIAKIEKWLGVDNIYVEGKIREVHHIEQALKAKVFFIKDKEYVVKDGEVLIVDEFTGRLMPGRRYSEGLHQAIEAKEIAINHENVEVQRESLTLATVTFQNYFRMYRKLAGMTGTAVTEAEEFHKIYNLETIVIPTNKPIQRHDEQDLIYRTEDGKFQAVIEEVKERNKLGQPILIGTISIEKNEKLADMMARSGLHPEVLNAKNHYREAEIIAQAGRLGAITIATNMAGRGVDIILGGNPPIAEEQEKVRSLGGLHVIGTERHESRRIDNQLRGRAGRQGDPGSSQFYVCTDDDLMRIFGGDRMKSLMQTLNFPEDMPIQNKLLSGSIESAQKKVEGNNFDMRKHLVEYDDVINKHREAIYRKRREALNAYESDKADDSGKLSEQLLDMVRDEISVVANTHLTGDKSSWNIQEVAETVKTIWNEDVKDKLDSCQTIEEALEYLDKRAVEVYDQMKQAFAGIGVKFLEIEKGIMVRAIDTLWIEHLETIDYLRRGIGLRGYGQHDPLVEYKKEAYRLYHELNYLIQKQVVYSIYKTAEALTLPADRISALAMAPERRHLIYQAPAKSAIEANGRTAVENIHEKAHDAEGNKVGRNDLCPCGSGKKYKRCCGI